MKNFSIKALAFAVILIAFVQTADAISLNPFKRQGRTRANTLFITGNFLEPRLIVELAQYRTKQPILLLVPDGFGNNSLYFMPDGTKPLAETADNFAGILALINPKQIIILGNADYVPAQFVDIAQKRFPVIILNNDDWTVNCQTLANLIDQPKLPLMYAEYKARVTTAQEAGKNVD